MLKQFCEVFKQQKIPMWLVQKDFKTQRDVGRNTLTDTGWWHLSEWRMEKVETLGSSWSQSMGCYVMVHGAFLWRPEKDHTSECPFKTHCTHCVCWCGSITPGPRGLRQEDLKLGPAWAVYQDNITQKISKNKLFRKMPDNSQWRDSPWPFWMIFFKLSRPSREKSKRPLVIKVPRCPNKQLKDRTLNKVLHRKQPLE